MKEDMLEVLIYLFENYIADGIVLQPDQEDLAKELSSAGFDSAEIDKAFNWLEDLLDLSEQEQSQTIQQQAVHSTRIFTKDELDRFKIEGQSLLIRLIKAGVLDQFSREMVIDRVMALDSNDINIEHIKWVVLMVLSNQPDFPEIAYWAEVVASGDKMPAIH